MTNDYTSVPARIVLWISLLSTTVAQEPVKRLPVRGVMPKAIANNLPIDPAQNRVVVKLAEQHAGLAGDGRVLAVDVLAVIAGRATRPFFHRLGDQLAEIRRRQWAATQPGQVPPVDLSLYFEVVTSSGFETRELVQQLNALAAVEIAYPRELLTPPPGDILPVTPDLAAFQGYRAAAPNGIDGNAITSTTGGMGAGIKVLDIELEWELQHEDLAKLRPSSSVGSPFGNGQWADHGTAVAGIISADMDIYGVSGFNPDVHFLVSSVLVPGGGYSVADAIVSGMWALGAGDVMVLEAQTFTPLGLGPTEWLQADFDAILIATGLGIITVEAAGNGSVDLDSPVLGGLFNTSVRDSGAIIVGASGAAIPVRALFSSYGSRIDANGWGNWVGTTGYGTVFHGGNDPRQFYTASFSGTSSATAIVAGAVTAVRGAAIAQLEPSKAAALDAFAIRSLLRATGTAITAIGNRPDCAELFLAADITNGLSVRNVPLTGQTCYIDLEPAFAATSNDLWAFASSLTSDNQAMPAPWLGRLLLGGTIVPVGFGTFGAALETLPVPIPNSTSLRGQRFFFQAFTYESASNTVMATNSVQLFLRR